MRRSLALVCLLFALPTSCAKDDDPRARRIEDCNDCDPDQNNGVYTPPTGSHNDSMAPPDNMPDEDSGAGTGVQGTLTGDVMMLTGTNLKIEQDVDSQVEISALAASGMDARVTTRYDGDEDFSLSGVQITGQLWVGVRPVGNPTRALMSTLQTVNSTLVDPLHLKVVERASMDDIAGASGLLTPVTLDPERGHLVVYFVNQDNNPVSGIRILDTAAIDGSLIAYDAGNVYSDSLEQTNIGGSALLLNLNSIPFPGEEMTVAFNFDGLDSSFPVHVARDTLTIAAVLINN
jgi:hypothetical protein